MERILTESKTTEEIYQLHRKALEVLQINRGTLTIEFENGVRTSVRIKSVIYHYPDTVTLLVYSGYNGELNTYDLRDIRDLHHP